MVSIPQSIQNLIGTCSNIVKASLQQVKHWQGHIVHMIQQDPNKGIAIIATINAIAFTSLYFLVNNLDKKIEKNKKLDTKKRICKHILLNGFMIGGSALAINALLLKMIRYPLNRLNLALITSTFIALRIIFSQLQNVWNKHNHQIKDEDKHSLKSNSQPSQASPKNLLIQEPEKDLSLLNEAEATPAEVKANKETNTSPTDLIIDSHLAKEEHPNIQQAPQIELISQLDQEAYESQQAQSPHIELTVNLVIEEPIDSPTYQDHEIDLLSSSESLHNEDSYSFQTEEDESEEFILNIADFFDATNNEFQPVSENNGLNSEHAVEIKDEGDLEKGRMSPVKAQDKETDNAEIKAEPPELSENSTDDVNKDTPTTLVNHLSESDLLKQIGELLDPNDSAGDANHATSTTDLSALLSPLKPTNKGKFFNIYVKPPTIPTSLSKKISKTASVFEEE